MKKYLIIILSVFPLFLYSQNDKVISLSKNSLDFSVLVLNTTNYEFAKNFTPEIAYSRYVGNNLKFTASYSKYNYSTGIDSYNYGMRVGFLPIPLFVKNEKILNSWESELSINYQRQIQKGNYDGVSSTARHNRMFIKFGLGRKIYGNFYSFVNIDLWNDNKVFAGLRYKF